MIARRGPIMLLAVLSLGMMLLFPPRAASAADELDPRAALRIENLLADAEVALAAMRLTAPGHDNAYDRYRQVLDFLPDDPRALQGLQRIADAYFGRALQAAEQGDRRSAERLFERGAAVAGDHPSRATVSRSIERLLAAPVARQELDADALAARDDDLAARLKDLGGKAKQDGLMVVIRTPNDALGRWVYQQMNAAPPNVRLRARSELGSPAAVTLRREP